VLWWLNDRVTVPLNNQSPAVTERSSTCGDATPRGITLNRQNSIGAGGGGSAAASDRYRGLRQAVAPVPSPTPAAISSTSPVGGTDGRRNVDDKGNLERVSLDFRRRGTSLD